MDLEELGLSRANVTVRISRFVALHLRCAKPLAANHRSKVLPHESVVMAQDWIQAKHKAHFLSQHARDRISEVGARESCSRASHEACANKGLTLILVRDLEPMVT